MPTLFPKEIVAELFANRSLCFERQKPFKNGFKYFLKYVPSKLPSCIHCVSQRVYKFGKAVCTVRDQPISTAPIWLEITKHRYRCRDCKKVHTEQVPGIGRKKRFSFRFESFLAEMCEKFSCLKDVQNFYSCSSGFLYKLYYKKKEQDVKEKLNYPWPEIIGIDEHFFSRKKGYTDFATVITDIKGRRLYEMVEGKNKANLQKDLTHIPGRENVKIVAMDLSSSFRSFVQDFFPNALIVADKFHVLKLLTPTLIKMRKELSVNLADAKYKKLMLKNRKDLDYYLRCELDRFLKQHPDLNTVYRFKERLFEFYRTKGTIKALRGLYKLINDLKATNLAPLIKLAGTLQRWKKEIVFYFENRLTNAMTEAFNKTAKLVQRRANGFKSFKNYRLRTLSACS